ncbi:hypothetical protein [Pantoea stewartii]|uniref:Uncharacterized protein n=1 Tax=Pantoea stewartii subsp. stewartii DC283 TaxID=660596 RepID=H3RLK8_PANSE|nr:hypothetical protein [Pantoea stewartii]ARF52765.1 hypothetical protein DSJ_26520 [Pantoea stewartii subsp. stewartii DC283]EHT97721.1 hypothetical protein CKS_5583 [Pantoea stewartii subsp. stewartii DC283]
MIGFLRGLRDRRRQRESSERRAQLRRKAGISPQPLESLLPGEPYSDGVAQNFANVLIAQEAEATRRAGSLDRSHNYTFGETRDGSHSHSHGSHSHSLGNISHGSHSHSISDGAHSHSYSHSHDSGSSFDSSSSGGGDSSW